MCLLAHESLLVRGTISALSAYLTNKLRTGFARVQAVNLDINVVEIL